MANKVCSMFEVSGLLVDITGHGKSSKTATHVTDNADVAAEKTNFSTCVADIEATLRDAGLCASSTADPLTIVGHSLGGRLGLQCIYEAKLSRQVRHLWLLDTVPGQVNNSVEKTVEAAEQVLDELPPNSKRSSVETMLRQRFSEIDNDTVKWLASSFNEKNQSFHFDLRVVRDIMADFPNQNLLRTIQTVLKRDPGLRIDLVRGGKNQGWTASPSTLPSIEALKGPQFASHLLPNAGHWVHIDDLPGLLQVFRNVGR